ncbi:hypothetical protein GOARA_091_00250 [Gordonia araii NBRC 100433]|uniref:ESAT-6-like protein n=1 Tax=Gordonia araii NBRC 100433 TaxID=1073574 RepID=G7H7T2_9ACTN|nr:WXG100 family type VII secretion target [Gordonia araii]NNG95652.1 WXG100 family type VII secretion target [Gordonia araii NBRC 100433]GAB11907.1 hypothetical protein GOARA_091_00250 [Gordonia araii NBRC 100433]
MTVGNSNAFELDLDAGFKHTNTVDEIVASMRQTLSTISNEVDGARATWQGGAFAAFNNTANEWDAEAQRLNRSLDTLRETLSNTVFKGSATADEDIASAFKGIQAGGLNL